MTLEEFLKEFESANRARDPRAPSFAHRAGRAVLVQQRRRAAGNRPNPRNYQTHFTAIQEANYEVGAVRWMVRTDDCAVCVFSFHWTGNVGGKQVEASGRGTRVLEQRDGHWRMVHEHLSRGPA